MSRSALAGHWPACVRRRCQAQALTKPASSAPLSKAPGGEACFRAYISWRDGWPMPCGKPWDPKAACDCAGLLALGQACLQAAADYLSDQFGNGPDVHLMHARAGVVGVAVGRARGQPAGACRPRGDASPAVLQQRESERALLRRCCGARRHADPAARAPPRATRSLMFYSRCGIHADCAACVGEVAESKVLQAGPLPGPQPVAKVAQAQDLPAVQAPQAAGNGGQP